MRAFVILRCLVGLARVTRADDPPPGVVVTIIADGTIVIAGDIVPDDKLDARFRKLAAKDKDRPIYIDADKAIEAKRVDAIVARAKAAGLTHVTLGRPSGPSRIRP